MLVSGHNSTLGREGADALPSFDCQGTADSLGCSVSCMTHIPLAQQVSMETCNIPCHHSPPPLFLIPYTSAIYRRCKVMGTCDPRYSFLCKTCANTQTSLISLHCLSFRQLSFFPTVCVWAGAFCTSLQGDVCIVPQCCLAFDHYFLAARAALLPAQCQKMPPLLSEAVRWVDGWGGHSFQASCEDINQGAGPLLPGPHHRPLTLLFNIRQLSSNSDPKYSSCFWGDILKTACH